MALECAGHTTIAVGNDKHVCGLISISDGIREDAAAVVASLKQLGIQKVVMLTGDNQYAARSVGAAAKVDDIKANLLPEDKLRIIEELTASAGHVAMIGDGVNDAPALAAASLGIAMGSVGTDAAIETADIALMADDLTRVPWLIRHAHKTMAIVRQNIIFSVATKFVFMALALANLATLWMAIAADMGVSLLVILNSLRLLRHQT